VEVHLYGSLRHYALDSRPDQESVVRMAPRPGETVATVLEQVGVSPSEVYHVFLNGALIATSNTMAPWLRYQRGRDGKGLDTPVQPGDRLGLFARDMGLLVI
jgi:hypothetical protein